MERMNIAVNTEIQNVKNTISKNVNPIGDNVIKRFVDYVDVSPVTLKAYVSGIRIFIEYLNANGLKSPVRDDVIAFKRALQSEGKSPATIGLYLSAIRRLFAWCEAEGIYANITAGVKAPKKDKGHKRDYLSGSQIAQVLDTADRATIEGKRNFAIMAVMSVCGLRTVEIVRANVEDIRTLGNATVLYVQGKGRNDKKEFVKLTAPVIEAINDYLRTRGHVRGNAPLFASCSRRNCGGRLTTRTISSVCKSAMITAGYNSSRLTAHSLRHSAVTIALMAGQSLSDVQAFARHSNIQTTQIYAHNVDRLKSACESALTEAIFSCLKSEVRK